MKKIGIELNERFQPLIAPPLGDPGGSEQHGGRDANRSDGGGKKVVVAMMIEVGKLEEIVVELEKVEVKEMAVVEEVI